LAFFKDFLSITFGIGFNIFDYSYLVIWIMSLVGYACKCFGFEAMNNFSLCLAFRG